MGRIRKVMEADGSLSPYRERKIAESIHRALRESGSDDRGLADELAGVVSLFLERTFGDAEPPKIADIQDTVERVLRETGNDSAARKFTKVRRQREELRDQIIVRGTMRRAADDVFVAGDQPGVAETSSWSRSRLVRSLQESAELPAALSEEIASEVEKKVFGLGLKSLSSDLVRHLVECELFERGIETGDRAGERIPISVRSLADDVFESKDGAPLPSAAISEAVFEHFALAELHGPLVAAAHAGATVHVHGLERPLAIESLELPWRLAVRRTSSGIRGLLDLSRTLEALAPHVAGPVVLGDAVARVIADAGSSPEAAIDDLLDVSSRGCVELGVPIGVPAGVLAKIAARLASRPAGALRIRLFGAEASEGELVQAFGLMRQSPFVALDLAGRTPEAQESGGPERLRFSLARVTVNLPLLLMDASGDGLKDALGGLDAGSRAALEAFRERAWVQRKGPRSGLPAIVEVLGGPGRVAVPASGQEVEIEAWGLGHAIGLLARRGIASWAAVPEAAARILGRVLYQLGEEKDGVQFVARLGGASSRRVRKRMLTACEKNARRLGIGDFLAELRNERTSEGVLPLAIPLSDRRNRPLMSSSVVERLGFGLGLPEAAFPEGLEAGAVRAIRELSRLRVLELAPPGTGAPFEVQEELFG